MPFAIRGCHDAVLRCPATRFGTIVDNRNDIVKLRSELQPRQRDIVSDTHRQEQFLAGRAFDGRHRHRNICQCRQRPKGTGNKG
ncbi:MAG: hypothetical protein NC241_01375 [Bacteroides sp.]|nr:hypothetical protein [Bacteroides sp.]MCM1458295.1 hypothetical protein [Lachnoclostridium sp.]